MRSEISHLLFAAVGSSDGRLPQKVGKVFSVCFKMILIFTIRHRGEKILVFLQTAILIAVITIEKNVFEAYPH